MKQIENFTLHEICIYITYLQNIRLLPGINLIDEESYEQLQRHPAFKNAISRGIIAEIHVDENEFLIDEETNITILQSSDEKVPIQNVNLQGTAEPLAQKGIVISIPQAKKAGLNDELASRLIDYMPQSGWVSEGQIRERLQLDDAVDLSKLPFSKPK